MGSATGLGGTHSSGGTLANYGSWTGVSMATILNLYGGSTSSSIRVTDVSGSGPTYTYDNLNGTGISFWNNSSTVAVTPNQPLTMILAYYYNGTSIGSSNGPLRTIAVGSEGLYEQGNMSWRSIVKLEIL
jgi:hypothetical protein